MMIFKKTVLVVALTSFLVACGGGGGGDSTSSSSSTNNSTESTQTLSDLDKAKQLITTANTIISYYDSFEDIQTTYQPSLDAVAQVSTDVKEGSNLVLTLAALAYNDAQGSNKDYNSEQIAALYSAYDSFAPDYKLNNNTFSIQVRGSTISITGTTDFERWVGYDFNGGQIPTPVYANKTTLKVKDLVLTLPTMTTSVTSYSYNIKQGGTISTINTAQKTASVSFSGDSSASIAYASSKIMDERTENEVPTSASLKLNNVVLQTNDNFVATLTELSAQAKAANFIDHGEAFVGLVPYELKLNGTAALNNKDNLGINATVKLNNDLSKTIDITGDQESLNNFLNVSMNIALTGKLQAKTKQTPFSLNINALRNEYTSGNATADIDVDGNALNIQFFASGLDQQEPVLGATIKHKNGAYVSTANLQSFVSTNIMVGNQSYGTLSKTSGSVYNAKFSDDSIITIAP